MACVLRLSELKLPLDHAPADLTPASWPVEFVLVANQPGRAAFLDARCLQHTLVRAI